MSRYEQLKARQERREWLLPSEAIYIANMERIARFEIALLLPASSKITIGHADAEKILQCIKVVNEGDGLSHIP